jgi:hypothetical protein
MDGVLVLVQRREVSKTVWSAVSSWLPAATHSHDDADAKPFITCVYRLLVKSAAGVVNTTFNEVTIIAAYAAD